MNMNSLKSFSSAIVRIGIALVFIWFGVDQLIEAASYSAFIPQWVIGLSSLPAVTIVHINGVFEIVFGSLLLLGFFTRFAAFLLALHMIDITLTVGYDSIGVRDFGLSAAVIAVWLNGADQFSLDRFVKGSDQQ